MRDTCFSILTGNSLLLGGKEYSESNNLDELVIGKTYYISDTSNKRKQQIKFQKSENVSTIFVETATNSMSSVLKSKDHKELAKVTIIDKTGVVDSSSSDLRIKGRGNSTWQNCEKKPFSILFQEPKSILGMRESSKWALLANALDYSGIRNAIVLDTARKVGLDNTPEYAFVDLYLNGKYNGLYLLCQPVETFYERSECIKEDDLYLFSAELNERVDEANYPIYVEQGEAVVDVCIPHLIKEMTSVEGVLGVSSLAHDGEVTF